MLPRLKKMRTEFEKVVTAENCGRVTWNRCPAPDGRWVRESEQTGDVGRGHRPPSLAYDAVGADQ